MNFTNKRAIYDALPLPAKRLISRSIPFAWLAGRSYREAYQRGAIMHHADEESLRRWQQKHLRELLLFATEQVPAYQHLAHAATLLPPFEALSRFPLITKDDLQLDPARYLPGSLKDIPHYQASTGGTSGKQFTLLHDDGAASAEAGFIHRLWKRVGYRPGMRKATFRGVAFASLRPTIFWQENPIYGELQFSPYHMNRDTMPLYWKAMVRYRPHYLHGYPSAITYLAQWLKESGISATTLGIKAVLLGSEGTEPWQRVLLQQVFGARVFSWYGHTERVILAGECEHSEAYHAFPDYGILEIINPATGQPVNVGETGELVGTGLFNRSLPLIRYRTGDLARKLDSHCACGRHMDRFDQVQGRWEQNHVTGKNGSQISLAALNIHGSCLDHVERFQYYQNKPGQLEFRIVPSPAYTERDTDVILTTFRQKLAGALEIQVHCVPDIPLTPRGKFKRLIVETSTSDKHPPSTP